MRRKVEKILKDLGCDDKELSILLTDDERIAQLNKHYLGREGPTNVLAFPMGPDSFPKVPSYMMGDVVISLETAVRESKEQGEPSERVVDRLLIHGILHLLGYDHEISSEESLRMDQEEHRLMALLEEE
ncbi:MAG: rRNA maturation RNase YbeY [Desulfatiglans sp.]|nr:rRNA maturation RNase YbeY [Thermodesulfobacteriota bacterium]MEE4353280.1 rRNA maturation RNase YbeY [Desulfatiglans sp.]